MATRSRIGIQLSDDSILSVYCHYDGYPEFNGVKLVEHFNSYEKASDLIDGGDMSTCWTNERWTGDRWGSYPNKVEEYGPQYYSQRGEDCPPRLDADLCEYLLPNNSEEYSYLFVNGRWVCYNMNQFNNKLPEVVEIPVPVAA